MPTAHAATIHVLMLTDAQHGRRRATNSGIPRSRARRAIVSIVAAVVVASVAFVAWEVRAVDPHEAVDVVILQRQIHGDDLSIRWRLVNRSGAPIGYGVDAEVASTRLPWVATGAEGLIILKKGIVPQGRVGGPERIVVPLDNVPRGPLEVHVPLTSMRGSESRGVAVSDPFTVP